MNKKSGFVSIIGPPNAGKSTLINTLIGYELSIVTPKAQTTRNRIYGIYTKDNIQIVFTDTPGILEPKYKLQHFMKREIDYSVPEADVILFVTDLCSYDVTLISDLISKYIILNTINTDTPPVIFVLNKIDLIRKEKVLEVVSDISKNFQFSEIIPLSAKKKFNTDKLFELIIKYLPQGEFYFDDDVITSQPERFFVSEIIRLNILKLYNKEIPFSVYVDIEEFTERNKKKDYIRASVIVERESQKSIIIGRQGKMIKILGEKSRIQIEEFLERSVFLELYVKVSKNWKNDEKFIKSNFRKLSSPLSS